MFKPKVRLLTIGGVLALAATLAAISIGRNVAVGASSPSPRGDLERVSNTGTAVSASPRMQTVLERTGTANGVVRYQGQRAAKAFYRLTGTPRGACYGIGFNAGSQADLNQLECGGPFPSTDQPVLDASIIEQTATGDVRLVEVQGWAADGVASLAALDTNDQVVAETPVSRNIYVIDEDALRDRVAVKLVAKDRTGSVIYTQLYD